MKQESPQPTPEATALSRRTLAQGAAWAIPVAAVVAAAPVMAASTPGLQGWVEIGKRCRMGSDTLTIDGTGGNSASPPDNGSRGLWVYRTTAATTLEYARITFYYPSSLGTITWSAATENADWSVPVVSTIDPAISGYTAYTTYYTGGWTFYNLTGTVNDYTRATGRPNFTGSAALSDNQCRDGGLPVYARRTVTVNGEVISFLRGPVNL